MILVIKLVILYLLLGLLLGQQFKVLILVPATAVVAALTIFVDISRGDTFWLIAIMVVVGIVSLQIGYLLGIGIHELLVSVHVGSAARKSTNLGASSPRGF